MSKQAVSILGCGWLGKPLGAALVKDGYAVMGSTTRHENIGALEAAGIEPFVFHVDQLPTNDARPFFNSEVLIISLPQRARVGKAELYKEHIRKVVAAAQAGRVTGMLLLSTTSVYANVNRVVIEQDADVDNPITQAEQIAQGSKIPTSILRFAGLFGPDREPGRFHARMGVVPGGKLPVNLIHQDDCIGIIKRIIQRDVWNETFNVCADDHPTKREFYTRAANSAGLTPPTFLDEDQTGYKIVSNARLKEVLNYRFIHRLS